MPVTAAKVSPSPSPLYLSTYKAKLAEMRSRFAQADTLADGLLGAEREWGLLHSSHRLALLLLAGVDGDISQLAQRAWRELPNAERLAIASAARTLKRSLAPLHCLTA